MESKLPPKGAIHTNLLCDEVSLGFGLNPSSFSVAFSEKTFDDNVAIKKNVNNSIWLFFIHAFNPRKIWHKNN